MCVDVGEGVLVGGMGVWDGVGVCEAVGTGVLETVVVEVGIRGVNVTVNEAVGTNVLVGDGIGVIV